MDISRTRLGLSKEVTLTKAKINQAYKTKINEIDRQEDPDGFQALVAARRTLLAETESVDVSDDASFVTTDNVTDITDETIVSETTEGMQEADSEGTSHLLSLYQQAKIDTSKNTLEALEQAVLSASLDMKKKLIQAFELDITSGQWIQLTGWVMQNQIFPLAPIRLIFLMEKLIPISIASDLPDYWRAVYQHALNEFREEIAICPGGLDKFDSWKAVQIENFHKLNQLEPPEIDERLG